MRAGRSANAAANLSDYNETATKNNRNNRSWEDSEAGELTEHP